MSVRTTVGVVVAASLLVGIAGWIGNMPQPARLVGAAPPLAAVAPVAAVAEQGDRSGGSVPQGATLDPGWIARVSTATEIPPRALQAYALAARSLGERSPSCRLGWNTLAAIGLEESAHGTIDGAHIDDSGELVGRIVGPALDGGAFAAVGDTDGGTLDGDTRWDHAVGPMQFIPATWKQYGADGNGDGVADPNDIDDAALTAGLYLCADDRDLTTAAGWEAAVRSYNDDDAYAQRVRAASARYAENGG